MKLKMTCKQIKRLVKKLFVQKLNLTFIFGDSKITGKKMDATFPISKGTFTVQIAPTNDAGTTPTIPLVAGSVAYDSSDPNVFTVQKDPTNENQAIGTIVGAGTAVLTVSANNTLIDISETANVTITPDQATDVATHLNITLS